MFKSKRNEVPPITAETTLENARKWLNIIRYGESGTVIQLQDDCEYRVLEIINNSKILKSILGPYYRKYLLQYVPTDQRDLHQAVKEALIKSCVERNIGTKGTLAELQNQELVTEIAKKGYEVGLFISHITPLLKKKDYQPFIDLELLVRTSKNISLIVFSEFDITHERYGFLLDKCSFLYDHIIKYPMYNEEDARQFITRYSHTWNFSYPEKVIKEIIHSCGGYLWIIHQTLRSLRDNHAITLMEAFTDELMIKKLETIWGKFTEEKKDIMRKVYFGTINTRDTLTHEYDYLLSIRIIKKVDKQLTLGIPLLSQVIDKETRINRLKLYGERVFINEKEITTQLTKKERIFVNLLLASKKKIIPRDTIAQAIWGKDWEEKYSDWAIDRLAFRIRKKLKALGIDEKLLKTVKKKGFIFG